MPKRTPYFLRWHAEHQAYGIETGEGPLIPFIDPDGPAWFAWLDTVAAFSFHPASGETWTVRQESGQRGGAYWYAYSRISGERIKRYVGRTNDLTVARLVASTADERGRASGQAPAKLLVERVPQHPVEHGRSGTRVLPTRRGQAIKKALPASRETSRPALLLLTTKCHVPRTALQRLARPQILALLRQGLAVPLTLLSAPAGFGKTVAMASWAATLPHPVAWVSLDASENDPMQFWTYVLTALDLVYPGLADHSLAILSSPQPPPSPVVLRTLLNMVAAQPENVVLMLDDYHLITNPDIHASLRLLLEHPPAQWHLYLATRVEPPLPLARLRASGQVNELRAEDLRFRPEEVAAFLGELMGVQLSAGDYQQLAERADGWIAGLQLAGLSLQRHPNPARFVATFGGTHRQIMRYLGEEILTAQSEEVQSFLLETSILGRLSGPLCDAVTGRQDGQTVLEQLDQANLFLVALDEAGQWYRYHHLFAEAMQDEARRRLGTEALQMRALKASQWFEQEGLLAEAVEAALDAAAFERAATLLEHFTQPGIFQKTLHTLRRWIGLLPEETRQTHPALCFTQAMVIHFTSDRRDPTILPEVIAPLDMAEQRWRAEDNRPKVGEVLALRSQLAWWQEDYSRAFLTARQSLDWLPEHEHYWRGVSLYTLGREALFAGNLDLAWQITHEALRRSDAAGNGYAARAATLVLAEVCARQGKLHQAAHLYRQVLAQAGEDASDQAAALTNLALLSYEWNDLEAAEQQATQALVISKQHVEDIGRYLTEESLLIPASLVLARVFCARGRTGRAKRLLDPLAAETEERAWPLLHRAVRVCLARLALQEEDRITMQRWAETLESGHADLPLLTQEEEALVLARWRIAQGRQEEALSILERWKQDASMQGRRSSELEILVLEARAHFTMNELQEATQLLLEALPLARSEGYQRLVLDEGRSMEDLLQAALPQAQDESLASYIQMLLRAFAAEQGNVQVSSAEDSSGLLEPLSLQEHRVLLLLAAGRSNPEIAEALVVSINTVKTQVQSIYRKLGVNSRWQAREAARRLQLL
jgi:LuxR family maltose regulon positive regulatory protein